MSVDLVVKQMFGTKAALILPVVPDDAPHAVREGIARRRITMETGHCPCGAVRTGPNRAQRRQMARDRAAGRAQVWHLEVLHENDCPAIDATLEAAILAWRGVTR